MVETLTKGMALRIGGVVYRGKSSRHSVEAYKWEALRHGRLACQGKSLRHGGGVYHEVHGRLAGWNFALSGVILTFAGGQTCLEGRKGPRCCRALQGMTGCSLRRGY